MSAEVPRPSRLETRVAPEALAVVRRATAFYPHHGFIPCADQPLQLYLPLASCRSRI